MRSKAQKIGGYPATPIFRYIRRVNPPGAYLENQIYPEAFSMDSNSFQITQLPC